MKLHENAWLLPEFPKIPHVPYKANLADGDIEASFESISHILNGVVYIEEKIDGASCGMAVSRTGNAVLRNRKHVLNKGYEKANKTPAKAQFVPAWEWIYKHKDSFVELNKMLGEPVGVYGEWCLLEHGIAYSHLPDKFIAYDIYIPSRNAFLSVDKARTFLFECGFPTVELLYFGSVPSLEAIYPFVGGISKYGTEQREGVILKLVGDNAPRYKMVRDGYIQNALWSDKVMNRQEQWR